MPQQIKHLLVFFVVLIFIFIIARRFLVPQSFGRYGHYRAESIRDNLSQEVQYAGEIVCSECHDNIFILKDKSHHRGVSCEVCHGPAYAHTQEPFEYKPPAPRERAYCPLCHEYNPSRPTGFPQIEPAKHNPVKPCISCHNPHNPLTPSPPEECEACHTEIARTKMVSPHALLACVQCHETEEEHKIHPRASFPSKPKDREFCGQCHSEGSESPPEVPRVDITTHGDRYLCWECHYPHSPEAHIKEEKPW